MAAAKRVFFSFLFSLDEAEGREDGDRDEVFEQLTEGIVFAKGREREGELVLGGAGDKGQARVVRVSALVGGDPAVERREVRRVLRLDDQTPDNAGVGGGRACEFVDEHT